VIGFDDLLSDLRDEPEKQKPNDGKKNVSAHIEKSDTGVNIDFV
jgi:hypothetical protein